MIGPQMLNRNNRTGDLLGLQRPGRGGARHRWCFHSAVQITGRQLLFSGGVVWLTDAIAFGLAFWELDCGGPVAVAT